MSARSFGTPYALATKRIATDGLARAGDGRRPFREFLDDYLRFISWGSTDAFAERLRLRQYPDVAPVVIDPRFGWGAPVVEETEVPVESVVRLWQAGESGVADGLIERGMGHPPRGRHFRDDAQDVPDEVWLVFGLDDCADKISRAVGLCGQAAHAVGAEGVRRTWP